MKNIFLHESDFPLGTGIKSLVARTEGINKGSKWLYIVPSQSLIKQFKSYIIIEQRELLGNIQIMTFDQLMRKLMINEQRRLISPEEQELIVKNAIESVNANNQLSYFQNGLGKSGFINQIVAWLGEIKQAGITKEELKGYWSDKSPKYIELTLIYEEYQIILERFLLNDREEPYFTFLRNGRNGNLSEYVGIITEQLHDFSPIQMKILNLLGEDGFIVNVHLAIDSKRKELFAGTYSTISFLSSLGFKEQIVKGDDNGSIVDSKIAPLDHLQKSLFSVFPDIIDSEGSIEVFSTAGFKQELELVAAEIKALVLNNNIELSQIAIITNELDKYQPYIHKIMDKAGIPNTLPKRGSLIGNPYIQSIISLLKVLNGNKNEWINMLYSPYFSFSERIDPSKLMKIIKELSYPDSLGAWNERFDRYITKRELLGEDLNPYNSVMKQIFNLANNKPLKGKNSDFVQYVEQLEKELRVRDNIQKYFVANPTNSLAYRDIKAYEKWKELKLNLKLIDGLLDKNQFILLLDWFNNLLIACERTDYDYSQNKKTGVNILSPNQIRGRKYKISFIIGLNEGRFPRGVKNDWLMPENERFHLRINDIYLNYSIDYENQQKYQFFQSVISAKEKLYLVYVAKTEDGKEQLRSFYIDEVVELFTTDSIKSKNLEISDITPKSFEQCINDNQLINKIYYLINNSVDNSESELADRYRLIKDKYPQKVKVINNGVISEQDRLYNYSSNYDGMLTENSELPSFNDKVWSTTQLNTAIQCKFAYFAKDILKLKKREELEASINPIDKGDLFHQILLRFFNNFRENNQGTINSTKTEEYYKLINEIAEEEWVRYKAQDNLYFDQIIGELDWLKIKQSTLQIVKHEIYWRNKTSSNFEPLYLEFSFGMPIDRTTLLKEEVDPSSVESYAEIMLDSRSILLRGKIDRVDQNGHGQYVIYDYKSGYAPDNKEILEGLNLQLPVYILVLEALFKLNSDQIIGAAFYTKGKKNDKGELTDNRNRGVWRSEFLDTVGINNRVGSKTSNEGWQSWIKNIKEGLEQLFIEFEKGNFEAIPKSECPPYCQYKSICRTSEEKARIKKHLKEG